MYLFQDFLFLIIVEVTECGEKVNDSVEVSIRLISFQGI